MYSTNKIKNRGILAGEVLNRWTDDGPDWTQEVVQETKPSRTNSRREREQKYLQKKQKKHTLDD
jgi:hypothetical protein